MQGNCYSLDEYKLIPIRKNIKPFMGKPDLFARKIGACAS